MMKRKFNSRKFRIIFVIILVIALGAIGFAKINKDTFSPMNRFSQVDFGNQKVMLNNQELLFVKGSYKSSDTTYGPHTASIGDQAGNLSKTRYVAILTDKPGGSGTFSYLVGAMPKQGKIVYSKPVLLGDRIKIISVVVDNPGAKDNGIVTVQYLDRTEGSPMSSEPTQEIIAKYTFQDDGNLLAVLH